MAECLLFLAQDAGVIQRGGPQRGNEAGKQSRPVEDEYCDQVDPGIAPSSAQSQLPAEPEA